MDDKEGERACQLNMLNRIKIKDDCMLPLAAVERIARKAGVERISQEAVQALDKTAEKISEELVKEILVLTRHAKRRTIKPEDIKLLRS